MCVRRAVPDAVTKGVQIAAIGGATLVLFLLLIGGEVRQTVKRRFIYNNITSNLWAHPERRTE